MLRQGKKRDAIEVWHYLQDRASCYPPRPSDVMLVPLSQLSETDAR